MIGKKELIDQIVRAFDNVAQPESITLHVAEALDNYINDPSKKKLDFIGKWQNIPSNHIEECKHALSYLDKFGMRYYLPAYMVWTLNNIESESEVVSNTLYALNHYPDDQSMSKYFQERFSLFSKEQLSACSAFVNYMAGLDDLLVDVEFSQLIYDEYWIRFRH